MGHLPRSLPASWPTSYPLHRPVLASEARALDRAAREWGLTDLVLMEHAAFGVASLASLLLPARGSKVVVLCGPGSNGGDGYGVARALHAWGHGVRVLRLGPVPRGEAPRLEHDLCARSLPIEDGAAFPHGLADALAAADVIVDALFGVGLDRPLSAAHADAIARTNDAPGLRLAVDVPSGLDADRGVPLPVCVVADVTATMAAPKRGFAPGAPGERYAGRVVEVDIGLPWALHAPHLAGEVP